MFFTISSRQSDFSFYLNSWDNFQCRKLLKECWCQFRNHRLRQYSTDIQLNICLLALFFSAFYSRTSWYLDWVWCPLAWVCIKWGSCPLLLPMFWQFLLFAAVFRLISLQLLGLNQVHPSSVLVAFELSFCHSFEEWLNWFSQLHLQKGWAMHNWMK